MRTAKLPDTLGPTKVTNTQGTLVREEAERDSVSNGEVVRRALDAYLGLTDGEVPADTPGAAAAG